MLLWAMGVQYGATFSRRSQNVLGKVGGVLNLNDLANWIARNKKKSFRHCDGSEMLVF